MSESSELSNESYVLYDRVMNPLTANQEQKTRKDRGTRRGCHSTSSSSAFNQPSSSHLNDDDDGNGEGTSRASTPSPIHFVNSLTNDIRDEHRGGLRSIGKGLKNLWKNMKKCSAGPLNSQPLQSHPSLDITLCLSPITPLDHIRDTSSPPSLPQPQPSIMGHPLYYNYNDYHGSTCINIIKIFYHGLNEITQEVLNAIAGGIFLYKTPNQAYQLLEDKVLLKLDWAKNQKTKSSLKKTVAFAAEGSSKFDTDKIMARMDAMTRLWPDLDEDDMPMSREEEAKFMQTFLGMPNYGKFLKELISNKHKIEQISAAFLSDESSAMIQNKVPPKLGDPGSFLIPCNFNKTFSYNALADHGASINLMPYSLYAKLSLKTLKPVKMSVILADRSFQYPVGIAENILVEVGKFIFPADFVILEMEEDSKVPLILGRPFLHTKVPLILGRPFLHTANAVIQVKQKQLNLRVRTERMIIHVSVIDEILEEDFDALLEEGSKILHSIEGTILEEEIFSKFDKFIAMATNENYDSEFDEEEPKFEKITINTDYKIKTSLEEPPTDLELKPLPDNLEYVFLEELYFLLVIISSQLSAQNKSKLIQLLDDKKLVVQKQRRLNPNMQEVVKKEIMKLLDTDIIYPISDSLWVSPINCVPKIGGIAVFINENDELVLTRTFTGWRHCKDAHLVLNWEKCHFMVKQGIVLGHKLDFLSQKEEFNIEIKDRKGTKNVVADRLSQIENEESSDDSDVDDSFPRETLMEINTKDKPWFADFANYLVAEVIPKGMTYQQKNKFFSDLKHYFWEEPYLFKICSDGIIRRCIYWNNNLFKEAHTLVQFCEACQKTGNISKRDEMPLNNIQAFRTAYKTPTGTTPYKLIYGKNCHLPFEIEHRAYWALKNCNPDLIAAGEKRMFQLHELDEFRHQAYKNSRLYKERTKVWHGRKLRMRKEFKQGNKVLLFHSKYKFKQPKLRSRWLGPYIVKYQYPSRYVEHYGKDENVIIVNGHRLKLHHEEDNDPREAVTPFFLKE
ncbi:reverse transcriptase domain-containing protein [Tanacetum coccineum]